MADKPMYEEIIFFPTDYYKKYRSSQYSETKHFTYSWENIQYNVIYNSESGIPATCPLKVLFHKFNSYGFQTVTECELENPPKTFNDSKSFTNHTLMASYYCNYSPFPSIVGTSNLGTYNFKIFAYGYDEYLPEEP